MEWVEITARTVEQATELALDQLGVDEQDAEIEVLEEPRPGLFGRVRGQARVRARVRPTQPRPKVERRDRRRGKADDAGGGERPARSSGRTSAASATATEEPADHPEGTVAVAEAAPVPDDTPAPAASRRRRSSAAARSNDEKGTTAMPELTIDEQADVVGEFLRGLAGAFGIDDATTTAAHVEEDVVEVRLEGGDLGLLVGPKGATLQLVQELARTVVQRRGGGIQEGRIRIDIAGYRQRRKQALERFVHQVAADVVASGARKALEPMNPADRKIVHDTINGIDGVRTISEGEEPRRRVVLLPDS